MYYEKVTAGLDWTGTPSLNEPHPYGPGIIAVPDKDFFEAEFNLIKQQFRIPQDRELRGHRSSPEILAAVLRLLLTMDCWIGIMLWDKHRAIERKEVWPKPAVLRHHTGVWLAQRLLDKLAIQSLYCDEDIRGKREQQLFRTDISRCNTRIHPASKMKIALWPSDKSNLIQCADVVTYVAARSLRPCGLTPELQNLWQRLQNNPRVIYWILDKWEEE